MFKYLFFPLDYKLFESKDIISLGYRAGTLEILIICLDSNLALHVLTVNLDKGLHLSLHFGL